ncbi:hypothetical protein M0804_015061 [Polistes exclamans]|nr:hypothetical protein M0804_015061 [Polistes exclamans]
MLNFSHDVNNWLENDVRFKLEAYDRTFSGNTMSQDQENVLEIVQLFLEMVNVSHWLGARKKSKSVVEYNKYMKEVDRADCGENNIRDPGSLQSMYGPGLTEAWNLKKQISNNKTTQKIFLLKVAIALIERHEIQHLDTEVEEPLNANKRTKRALKYYPQTRLSQHFKKHKLLQIVTGGNKLYLYRRSRICSANNKIRYTRQNELSKNSDILELSDVNKHKIAPNNIRVLKYCRNQLFCSLLRENLQILHLCYYEDKRNSAMNKKAVFPVSCEWKETLDEDNEK